MIRSQTLWAAALLLLGAAGCDVPADPEDFRSAGDPRTETTTAAAVGQQAVETLGRASAVLPSPDAPAAVSGPSCALAPRQPGAFAVGARALLAFVVASLVALNGRRRRRSGRKDGCAVIWGLLLVGWLGASRPAQAADAQASREHFKKGSAAYDLGRFDEAIKEFEAAYQARSDPALLFNIGQAHRLLGHVDAALRSYRAYLRKAPRAPNRAEVEARIKTMQAALNDTVLRPGEGGRLDGPAGVQPLGPEDSSMALTDSESSSSPGAGRRMAGLLTLGLGVAAIAGGVAWRLSADADAQRITQAGKDGQRFDQNLQDLEREGLRNHTLGTLSIGVGSAAVVAGALLYFLGQPSREGPRDAVSFTGASASGATGSLRFAF